MRRLPWILLSVALAACKPDGVCGNIHDMRQPEAGPDAALSDGSADAAARPPFSPARVTVSEAACLSFQLSTASGKAGDARRLADLQSSKAAGVTTFRGDFLWHRVEKTRGTFDFTSYDRRLAAAEAQGIQHLALLAYGNPWATTKTSSDPHYPPDDPADFAKFVSAVVKRYKGRIKTYEIWNEPNSGFRFWKGAGASGDARAFGALLKAAYKAAKAAAPQAEVLFGAPFFHDQVIDGHLKFMAAAHKAHPDLGKHYDGMALHPYALYPPSAPPEKQSAWEVPVGKKLAQVRALMARHGGGTKPTYVTEMGWPVWSKVSEAQQAAYLVRGFILLLAAGARMHCWYTLHDSKKGMTPTEATFGLLGPPPSSTTQGKQKAAYTAHKALVTTLGGYRLSSDMAREQGLPAGVHVYGLSDDKGNKAAVAWASGGAVTVDLKYPASLSKVHTTDIRGKSGVLHPSGDTVKVPTTSAPLFLRFY